MLFTVFQFKCYLSFAWLLLCSIEFTIWSHMPQTPFYTCNLQWKLASIFFTWCLPPFFLLFDKQCHLISIECECQFYAISSLKCKFYFCFHIFTCFYELHMCYKKSKCITIFYLMLWLNASFSGFQQWPFFSQIKNCALNRK